MDRTRRTIVLTGVAIVVGAAFLGYGLGLVVEKTMGPPPPSTPETPLVPPQKATPSPAELPTPPLTVAQPTPAPSPLPPVSPPPAPQVTFSALPASVSVGVPLRVRWQIVGGGELPAHKTRLTVTAPTGRKTESPTAQITSLPAAFEATVTIRERGEYTASAEAVVGGQLLRAQKTFRVE